jgi:alpha-beta hydrolase superfamily lysophospholipase
MSWPLLIIALIVFLALAALALFALRPSGLAQIHSHPHPSAGYDESVQRVAVLQAEERDGYHPECVTQLLTHGAKTERAVVLVHGYTSCPQQFLPLGRQFFERGDNVLVARLPHHGRADRLTEEQGGLRATELAAFADEVVDIAAGLGAHVTMIGLSGGGVTTAWAAQNRDGIDQAMIIAPAFGFKQVPAAVTVPLMNAVLLLPDAFTWWEPELKEKSGQPYTYPRYSRRALAEILRLGFATRAHAGRHPPAARSIVVVTNANDDSVDNAAAVRMASTWRAAGAANLRHFEFPVELKLNHDLIDPNAADARPELVYPKLLELLEGG